MEQRVPPAWMNQDQQDQWIKAFGRPAKKKKQSPANALTSAVVQYCKLLGCATARINTTGIYDERSGSWRFSGSTLGVEDVDVTVPIKIAGVSVGLKVAVEVKIGRDKQSDDQKKRQAEMQRVGAHYIIAKTFEEFKKEFDDIIYSYGKT